MTELQWAFVIVSGLALLGWWYAATLHADKIQVQESLRYYRNQRDSLLETVRIQSRTIADLKGRLAEVVGTVDRAGNP